MRLVAWTFLSMTLAAPAMAQAPDCAAVPGWTQAGEPREYAPDNLFDYMDGNAEGYNLYHFVGMKGVTCKCGEDTLVIDISEMEDPEFAYGMFTANKKAGLPIEKIGMAGQITPRKAVFVKGKYYVELAANPEKDHTEALRAFTSVIEKSLSGSTALPEALSWFPTAGLVADSARLVPESVLGIRLLKSGYVAQYDFGRAFVVREATPAEADQVMTRWKERIGQTTSAQLADEAFAATDRYLDGLFVFRKGAYVAGFANLKPGTDVSEEAAQLARRIN
jgi:hypothetical protein